jgi:integrase
VIQSATMRWQRGWVETEGVRGRKRYIGRYRADDGTKPKVQLGFVSELSLTEARSKLEAIVREIGSRPQALAALTLSEYWTIHYKPRHRVSWSEPTEAGYECYVRAYLNPAFGKVRLVDLKPERITTFFEGLRKKHSRSVVVKCWTLLKSILEDAVDDDILNKSPMRKVQHPKTKLPAKPVLGADLLRQVLTEVEDDAFVSAVLHVGTFCAMRTAEVFGLRWSAFCADHFLIRDSAWRGKLLKDATKTGERVVTIPRATRDAINRWRKVSQFTGPDDMLFSSAVGGPMDSHNFNNRVMAPLRDKLNLPVLTFQVLRRSHATRNQATPRDAQAHLGHKQITTTLGIYAQEVPATVKAMVEADETAILSADVRSTFASDEGGNCLSIDLIAPKLPPESDPLMA